MRLSVFVLCPYQLKDQDRLTLLFSLCTLHWCKFVNKIHYICLYIAKLYGAVWLKVWFVYVIWYTVRELQFGTSQVYTKLSCAGHTGGLLEGVSKVFLKVRESMPDQSEYARTGPKIKIVSLKVRCFDELWLLNEIWNMVQWCSHCIMEHNKNSKFKKILKIFFMPL